jgi:hypothetical protein
MSFIKNRVSIVSIPFELAVGYLLFPGYERIIALGHNGDIDTAPEDIWSGGGLYPWLSAATALEIVSDSVADTSAGTGARTVTIDGLDAAWGKVRQVVTLDGTTPVAIPAALYRVQSAVVSSAGSGRVNAGTINIRDVSGATVRAQIETGYGITRQSQYTVPLGHTLQITSMTFGINRPSSTRDATFSTVVQNSEGFYRMAIEFSVSTAPYYHTLAPGVALTEKTDFGMRCTYVSAVNTDVTAGWRGILRTNTAQ